MHVLVVRYTIAFTLAIANDIVSTVLLALPMDAKSTLIWIWMLLCILLVQLATAQQNFQIPTIPNPFRVGEYYPPRSETEVCRPIEDYIVRDSARFHSQLVYNSNSQIIFSENDSRYMTSRLQSRLNRLATLYSSQHGTNTRMTVLKAWTPFPDASLASDNGSLHYEGRTVQIRLPSNTHYNAFLQLAVEAGFDWVFFARSNLIRLSVIPTSCDRNIDCVFILDQSGSVGSRNHGTAIRFIKNVINFFTIGHANTRVGFVAYQSSSYIEFDLDDHLSRQSLLNAIDRIRYRGGGTRTGRALGSANTILLPSNNRGARPSTEGIPKIAILITDGKSGDSVGVPADNLKNSGVQVYTIGIANPRISELQQISSDPDDDHVFLLSSYNDALGFVDSLSVTTCDSQAIITPCVRTNSTVPENTLTYFQSSCSSFYSSIIIEVSGSVSIFCSTSATNPGPLTQDTRANISTGASTKHCTLPVSSSSMTVYIGVQGQATGDNQFSLVVNERIFDVSSVSVSVLRGSSGQIYDVSQHLIPQVSSQQITYRITNGNTGNSFQISSSGRISFARSNVEANSHFTLSVVAERLRRACSCAQLTIYIHVLNNEITFNPPLLSIVSVPEDVAIGHLVTTIGTDGEAGQVRYSILSGNTGSKFLVEILTGQIRVASQLDYETGSSYTLTIRAASVINPVITGTIELRITISDINESPFFEPLCNTLPCVFTISEDVATGSQVGTVTARDPDLHTSQNGMLDYSIEPHTLPFSIDSSGAITTSELLDYEAITTYSVVVRVRDRCSLSCRLTNSTTITINVIDINDNPPIISGNGEVEIPENIALHSVIAQYTATDEDSTTNAYIEYSIVMSDSLLPFQVEANGDLRVISEIDYERIQSYSFTVRASNPGTQLYSEVDVIVSVINLNDERPYFSNSYNIGIPEHSMSGSLVDRVAAIDNDLGSFGEVRYSITSGNFDEYFLLDPLSGNITTGRDIDREEIPSFSLIVEARDMGTPQPLVATTTVVITVEDVNDNAPVFDPPSYVISLREDTIVGSAILTVYASDADEPGNPNSIIRYELRSAESQFSINSSTGTIVLAQSLDYETVSMHQLTVIASDQGSPEQMSGRANVTITVENVNENPPSVSGNQTVSVPENAPPGSAIAAFFAEDSDQTAVTFMLRRGNSDGKFSVDSDGTVRLLNALDFETTEQYNIEVVVSDGDRSVTTWLTVNVLDINEYSPEFSSGSTTFQVEEEQPSGTSIGQLQATDRDGSRSMVTYSFAQQSQFFEINSTTGLITTILRLDREKLSHIFTPSLSQQRLTVVARDQGIPPKQEVATVTVRLIDINDNDPVFTNTLYERSLLENLDANQTVFELAASDLDLGLNAEVWYSFELDRQAGFADFFSIDEVSGVIRTTQSLDCELQTHYNFTLIATDMGSPSRQATSIGVLNLLDENDNRPSFSMNTYVVPVSESVETDTVLVTVEVEDADKGVNGEVDLSVINTNELIVGSENIEDELPFFEINSTLGEIVIKTGFNFELEQTVNVTVIATDRGLPRLSSTASVVFIVGNVDEEPPQFDDECSFFVPEDTAIHIIIGQCTATDRDNNAVGNVLVTYDISISDREMFKVNRTTGEITLLRQLDYETARTHMLTIRGTDQSMLQSFKQVQIIVGDVNDNAPQFNAPLYTVEFSPSSIQRQTGDLIAVSASDLDDSENGNVTYHLERVIQNELMTTLEITARDQGSPRSSNTTSVTMHFEQPCLLQSYTVGEVSGIVYADLLCSLEISPSSLNVALGGSNTFQCTLSYIGDTTVQWLHNGSLITQPVSLLDMKPEATYTIIDAKFDDSGEYACKVRNVAGSLQSSTGRADVLVPPLITIRPKDQAAKTGEEVTFTCAAIGIPEPQIEWFFEETKKIHNESTLTVTAEREGLYKCKASNSPDTSTVASAKLILYEDKHVIQLKLDHIANPSADGTCHYIDYDKIKGKLQAFTPTLPVVVGTKGEDICEDTACSSSPCKNGGLCVLSDRELGGYQCDCTSGYTGRNCTDDKQECLTDPCENNGVCSEEVGSYLCDCSAGFEGRHCQYQVTCSMNNCSDDSLCFNTQSGEYVCKEVPQSDSSIVVTDLTESVEILDDHLETYLEEILSASSGGNRNRRNIQFTTICEPRFVRQTQSEDSYALVWICPFGEEQPSDQEEASLCDPLLTSGYVQTCKPPFGEVLTANQPDTLPETSAAVDIILIKRTSNIPLDGDRVVEALKELRMKAEEVGFDVDQISALRSNNPDSAVSDKSDPSAAVGSVVGVLILICLVVLVVVIVVIVLRKRRGHIKEECES